MTASAEITILRLLADCTYATAPEIARACKLGPDTALAHLVVLESMRLVASRQDPDSRPARLVYVLTDRGRRKARIRDAE